MKKIPNIVIIGGGAGGLHLATSLGRQLGKKKQACITLIDHSLIHIWKPLLHEVAVGTIDTYEHEINHIFHASANFFNFQLGKLHSLNRANKSITLLIKPENTKLQSTKYYTVTYDILVISIGSTSNNYNIPGADLYCCYLDSLQQAKQFQKSFLEEVMASQQLKEQSQKINIAIIGAGATGVELSAELHYAIKQIQKYQIKQYDPKINISLIEASTRILSTLPTRIAKLALKKLHHININILTNEKIVSVTKEGVTTASGKFINANLKIWAAGIKGDNVLSNLDGLSTNHISQLLVKQTLQTTLDHNVYAFGDCAACPIQNIGKVFAPPRAQVASQQASLLTRSIIGIIRYNNIPLHYSYRDNGSLISISKQGTIGYFIKKNFSKLFIEGFIARICYVSLHKIYQIKLRGIVAVSLITLTKAIMNRIKPKLKLH